MRTALKFHDHRPRDEESRKKKKRKKNRKKKEKKKLKRSISPSYRALLLFLFHILAVTTRSFHSFSSKRILLRRFFFRENSSLCLSLSLPLFGAPCTFRYYSIAFDLGWDPLSMDFDSKWPSERASERASGQEVDSEDKERQKGSSRGAETWREEHATVVVVVVFVVVVQVRTQAGRQAGRQSVAVFGTRSEGSALPGFETLRAAQSAARCTFTLPLLPRASANCRVCGRYPTPLAPSLPRRLFPPFQPRSTNHLCYFVLSIETIPSPPSPPPPPPPPRERINETKRNETGTAS